MKWYRRRIADQILNDKLEAKGAVLIEGSKWCGKTTTATQIAKSILYMQDPAQKSHNLKLAELDPSLLLKGDTPRLIDEWQLAPQLWDAVRFAVDERDEFNQFILTGSSVPAADMSTSHSGTGRISRMTMRPMTLFESGDSDGSVSLKELFEEQSKIAEKSTLDIRRIAYLICRGGWPKALDQSEKIALRQAYDYYDAVVEADISNVDGVNRNPQRVKLLMRSLARYTASDTKVVKIREDMLSNDLDALSEDTIYAYINALNGSYALIEAKLGGSEIEEAARNLITLKNKIDTGRMKPPSFLMILTATGYGYQREDGVYITPIGCLKN